ncbi:MAG: ATP-binding cassette domain-containing protein, partial [Bacillota bacterium]|nr:ATP-binding cassette domain-containing protein [Bacillota bacterium]
AVMNGHLTMGVFTYLLQYFAMMLNTVEQFFNIGTAYQEYQASKMRLIEVLSMEKDDEGDKILDRIERIELVGLNYRHEEESENLYEDNVDATFVSGNLTHILGENGVGKSTILLCILGIYRNRQVSGEIKFNGTAASELNMSTLRKNNFSFMLQHPISFEGTVSEYMQSLLTEQEIQQVQDNRDFNQVFVHPQFDLNQIMEQEYDRLSGGEKQLLNLFVCLAKNASVYLLDEPTANVFPKMKESILSLLQKKADAGNIVIVVTHDHNMLSAGTTYTLR